MISETKFARGYSSFWMEYFPWLNSYTKSINEYHLDKSLSSVPEMDQPEHRSINNTIAFFHYRNLISDSNYSIEASKEEALQYMKRFLGNNVSTYNFGKYDKDVISMQIKNLQKIPKCDLTLDPPFPGCGIIDNCKGDILQGNKLIEVKAGSRFIQPADLKQLIVYYALNWVSSTIKYDIRQLEIFNPRVGYFWTVKTDELFYSVTNEPKEVVFEQLVKYLVVQSEEIVIE